MSNTFCIYSEDQPGVLSRVAALIYRRGYNIISIAAGPTEVKGVSRYTLVLTARNQPTTRCRNSCRNWQRLFPYAILRAKATR